MQRIEPKESVVVIVDVQQKLAAAMPPMQLNQVTRAATVLIEAAKLLGARVIATEQYPAGLGHTIDPIGERLAEINAPIVTKVAFSACDADGFDAVWNQTKLRSAVVLGMESHVCVFQTVRSLCGRGVLVHVPMDGVASRREDHRDIGLDLCRAAGATITTMETVVFDWLRVAGTDTFRQLSKLIR